MSEPGLFVSIGFMPEQLAGMSKMEGSTMPGRTSLISTSTEQKDNWNVVVVVVVVVAVVVVIVAVIEVQYR